jgi:lycopene beta-cyclase
VLPFSNTSGLIECTAFSENPYELEEYDKILVHYIEKTLGLKGYKVVHNEVGVIPMTNYQFPSSEGKVVNIGTAGGMTRASTGYTFYFIQKYAALITAAMLKGEKPSVVSTSGRASYFDGVLLNVLSKKKLSSEQIFDNLFSKNKPSEILEFLNSESSLLTDLKIISSLPTLPFLKAGLEQI